MMARHSGLGRGLSSLMQEMPRSTEVTGKGSEIQLVSLGKIDKNPNQPRQRFESTTFKELIDSIEKHGVVQPLLVRQKDERYELIAGERRLRAAGKCGLEKIPVIEMDISDQKALELTLIENLQRDDLNPIEEAEGYSNLASKFGLTQKEIAARVGKARATVANGLRLLELNDEIKEMLSKGELTSGHAKVLMGVEIDEERLLIAKRCLKEELSVRALEKIVAKLNRPARKKRAQKSDIPKDHLDHLTTRLQQHFGTAVRLRPSRRYANGKKGKGSLEIDFYSNEDLNRILEKLGLMEEL